MQQVIACRQQSPSHDSSSTAVCVSLLAVATGVSTPADVCYSQRFQCPSCGQLTDVPATQSRLPCCSIPKTEWLKEDITGRCAVLARPGACVQACASVCALSQHGLNLCAPRALCCHCCAVLDKWCWPAAALHVFNMHGAAHAQPAHATVLQGPRTCASSMQVPSCALRMQAALLQHGTPFRIHSYVLT
jgi:hypothetical protein